jgi:hypothetical protein
MKDFVSVHHTPICARLCQDVNFFLATATPHNTDSANVEEFSLPNATN